MHMHVGLCTRRLARGVPDWCIVIILTRVFFPASSWFLDVKVTDFHRTCMIAVDRYSGNYHYYPYGDIDG